MTSRKKILLVTGAYGSGTTALAGALAYLGVPTPQPFFTTNDPRTPVSFEHTVFRELILSLVNEETLSLKELPAGRGRQLCQAFADTLDQTQDLPTLLKFPAASLCLPWLNDVFDIQVVLVHRPFAAIEKTRERRRWPLQFGADGARVLYSTVIRDMIDQNLSFLAISYAELLAAPEKNLGRVMDFAGLQPLQNKLTDAVAFIRC